MRHLEKLGNVSSIAELAGTNFENFVAAFDEFCDIFNLSYEIGSIEGFIT